MVQWLMMMKRRAYYDTNHKEGWRGNCGHRRCMSLRGRRARFAPSDLDEKERAKKEPLRGWPTLSSWSPNDLSIIFYMYCNIMV